MKNDGNSVRSRVAVIGAGIFGCNIAYDLADFAEVVLFEKNGDILSEGSFINQFRHHVGYHYPRSPETVIDIQESAALFEERFSDALVTDTPTFYGLSKKGSLVTKKEFINFCDTHKLPYLEESPVSGLLNTDLLDLIIRVPEPSYHYETMKTIAANKLHEKQNSITIKYDTRVIGCASSDDKKKIITFEDSSRNTSIEEFDFVINATYAHMNTFAKWMSFPPYPVRVDYAEVLIVNIPGPQYSLTVIDGPFATIMPTGNECEYTLYHAKESILDRYTPVDGLVKTVTQGTSAAEKILRESLLLFPMLQNATVVESRIVHRGVLANHEHDDARVADIVCHGSGCWSVLSGKILSSVRTSKRISDMVLNEIHGNAK